MSRLYTDTYDCLELLVKSRKEDREEIIELKPVEGSGVQSKAARL